MTQPSDRFIWCSVCETREVRYGESLLFQYRSGVKNRDGTIEYSEWQTSSVCPNYGDVFDKKPSFWTWCVSLLG